MKPLYERVLVLPYKKEMVTNGGIMLPEKAIKRPNIGTVIACGEGTHHNKMMVQPGDIVLCNRFAGAELKIDGNIHYMLMSNEIMAILDDKDEIALDDFD